jgi:hypothetical protein
MSRKITNLITIFVLLMLILIASMEICIQSANANNSISIQPIADSYVDNSNPSLNYGQSLFLYTHLYNESVAQASAGSSTENKVGPIAQTWLKFDLSGIPSKATIYSAVLRMHTSMWGTRSNNKVGVFVCQDNSWTESEISWNNAPKVSSNSLDTRECADPDMDYEFDLSTNLEGKRSISLVLETLEFSKMPVVFNSNDLNPKTGPILIISYDEPVDVWIVGVAILSISALVFVGIFFRYKRRLRS